MRVLVVDDDPDLGLLVELFLRRAGHEVVLAADGVLALGLLAQCRVDARPIEVVVLDQMMPRLDGVGLTRAIRADPATTELPLLMMSAHHEPEAALEAGVDGFVGKPFTSAGLLAALETVVAGRQRDQRAARVQPA
ncbi:response regulator [Nocardioides fonticola]|uniref:Response regulator n=1 Tax=Nocardioides fonticola TaxID=450363 RepID=A0ABP7XE29_9ACTN